MRARSVCAGSARNLTRLRIAGLVPVVAAALSLLLLIRRPARGIELASDKPDAVQLEEDQLIAAAREKKVLSRTTVDDRRWPISDAAASLASLALLGLSLWQGRGSAGASASMHTASLFYAVVASAARFVLALRDSTWSGQPVALTRIGIALSFVFTLVYTVLLHSSILTHSHSLPIRIAQLVVAAAWLLVEVTTPSGPRRPPRDDDRAPPLRDSNSILSDLTFLYALPMMIKHVFVTLEPRDVPELDQSSKTAHVVEEFRRACEAGVMLRAGIRIRLIWFFRYELLAQQCWTLVSTFARLWPAVLLSQIVAMLQARGNGQAVPQHAIATLVGLSFISNVVASSGEAQALIIGRRIAVRMRAILTGELYLKILRRRDIADKAVSDSTEQHTGAGRLQSLVSSDVYRVSELSSYVHMIFPQGLVSLIVTIILLLRLLGTSAIAGMAVAVAIIPSQTYLTQLFTRWNTLTMKASDRRLQVTQEALGAIRVVKSFVWESHFFARMSKERADELHALWKRSLVFAAINTSIFGSSVATGATTFLVHVFVQHRPLDAATAFGGLALFNALRTPLDVFSTYISVAAMSNTVRLSC